MSDSEYEEEQSVQEQALPTLKRTASVAPVPVQPSQPTQPTQPAQPIAPATEGKKKRNERGAGRKKGVKMGIQSEYQQSKLMADTFKEYTEMIVNLKSELENQKKLLNDTLNSEEAKHKKDIKNAVQEARMAFARTLNR